jgi:hypothetical protein
MTIHTNRYIEATACELHDIPKFLSISQTIFLTFSLILRQELVLTDNLTLGNIGCMRALSLNEIEVKLEGRLKNAVEERPC